MSANTVVQEDDVVCVVPADIFWDFMKSRITEMEKEQLEFKAELNELAMKVLRLRVESRKLQDEVSK